MTSSLHLLTCCIEYDLAGGETETGGQTGSDHHLVLRQGVQLVQHLAAGHRVAHWVHGEVAEGRGQLESISYWINEGTLPFFRVNGLLIGAFSQSSQKDAKISFIKKTEVLPD